MKYLPNILSISRIVISPVFFLLLISQNTKLICLSVPLFVIGAITDYFDGWFARRLKAQSKFGKFFDPLADKFLTGFAFLGFAVMSIIPVWMVLIILFRDVLATSMRFFPSKIISPIETSKAAKLKTFIQMAFIIILLFIIFLINCPIEFFPPPKLISFIYSDFVYYSMLFIVILTLWTLADYAKKYKI